MAYEYDLNDEEKDKQTGQLGNESAIVAPKSPTAVQSPSGSGQFTNLQQYLDANQSAKQGEALAGKVGETIKGAQDAQNQASLGFKSSVDKGSVSGNENLVQTAINNPNQVLGNEKDLAEFKKIRDAQYSGPKQLAEDSEDYMTAQKAVSNAKQEADASDSESGRFGLLDKYYGSGANRYDYTQGQKKLDQLLVQNDPNSQKAFQTQRENAQKEQENFGLLRNKLSDYAAQKEQETRQARESLLSQVGGAKDSTLKNVEDRYQQTAFDRQDQLAKLQRELASNQISAQNAEKYGLDKYLNNNQMNTFGIHPEAYISQNTAPSIHEIATPEEQARYSQLSNLLDTQNTALPYQNLAGTYDPNKNLNLNTDAFLNAVKGKEAEYNQLVNGQIFDASGNLLPGKDKILTAPGYRGTGSPLSSSFGNSLNQSISEYEKPGSLYNTNPTYRSQYNALKAVLDNINKKYETNSKLTKI